MMLDTEPGRPSRNRLIDERSSADRCQSVGTMDENGTTQSDHALMIEPCGVFWTIQSRPTDFALANFEE